MLGGTPVAEAIWYGSSAQTYFYAAQPAPTTTPTSQLVQSMADLYFAPAIVGLFFVVIVIGVILALIMLRKWPIYYCWMQHELV